MTRSKIFIAIAVLATSLPVLALDRPSKIIIVKADDVRCITPQWDRFFTLSIEKGVKVSAGIICNTLQYKNKKYFAWLKKYSDSGSVEFWNHGWDHKRWTTSEKKKVSEYGGSGYEHQKKHFDDSQKIMKQVLGVAPVAFGTPYNDFDADTIKVVNEDDEMRLFFCYKDERLEKKLMALVSIRGESDGVGKPNFEKFKAEYRYHKNVSFTAIQFHPNGFRDAHFTEYSKIVDFLIAEGWTFMLPSEYVAMKDNAR
jgi:peptidoglycan/xylan/chitin deacetylase (PgdA/CDA1 family)